MSGQALQTKTKFTYERRRPESTVLYKVIAENLETFIANCQSPEGTDTQLPAKKGKKISWARLLKRVFNIDITCPECQDPLKVISSIEDRPVIKKILDHVGLPTEPPPIHPARAPPQPEFDFDQDFQP